MKLLSVKSSHETDKIFTNCFFFQKLCGQPQLYNLSDIKIRYKFSLNKKKFGNKQFQTLSIILFLNNKNYHPFAK
jgi:hypothetical protein